MKTQFDNQIRLAINKHGDEKIDIIVEENRVYGIFHSNNNSFPVTDLFVLDEVGGLEQMKKYEAEFEDLCICEQ